VLNTPPFGTTLNLTNLADGDYVIEATARDNDGAETLVTINVTVAKPLPDNAPPEISFTSPGDNDELTESNVVLSANASDIVSVTFNVTPTTGGDPFSAVDTTAPYAVTLNLIPISNGGQIIQAIAEDNEGATTTVSINVTVAKSDSDGDGFSNVIELDCKTDPDNARSFPFDSDNDGTCNELDPDPAFGFVHSHTQTLINTNASLRDGENLFEVYATGDFDSLKVTIILERSGVVLSEFMMFDDAEDGNIAGDISSVKEPL